tara:strand:- start:597 stop:935 length:339 start_codon:yes stop_codon:yes gene_type:complete
MKMYKIINDQIIHKTDVDIYIPKNPDNRDYQQFILDVKEQGTGIVEGADVFTESYSELREKEYPSKEDQLDKIFHSGVDAWKADIQEIKDKYPKTITGGTTIADIPSWVESD